jgi:hypothetical protein
MYIEYGPLALILEREPILKHNFLWILWSYVVILDDSGHSQVP